MAQRARKLIATWADANGGWDRAMADGLASLQPAVAARALFDGRCRRCGGVCVAADLDVSLTDRWYCLDCDWEVELVGDHMLA